jgi:perosamine synthetase
MSSDVSTAPAIEVIPLTVPQLRGNEWSYVRECLDTNFLSSVGPFVGRFEREFAERLGAPSAVATVNGTAALHVALLIAGVQPGDEVLVSTLTFIAPVNTIRYVGAVPVLIDAEPEFWQMDARGVLRFLERDCEHTAGILRNRATRRRVSAILPVHILGHPVDMDPILEAARRFGLPVVEDAAESLGATYKGRPVGCLGDVGCFSFNGNKVITSGGGGMLVTRRTDWAERARYLTTQARNHPSEYIHHEVGYNYRLTNIAAAIGCAQLELLDDFLAAKRRIHAAYADGLAAVPGVAVLGEPPWGSSGFWMTSITVDSRRFGRTARELIIRLRARAIESRPLWQPAHLSPAHGVAVRCSAPVADSLYDSALSLPSSTGLTPEHQQRVIDEIVAACRPEGDSSNAS